MTSGLTVLHIRGVLSKPHKPGVMMRKTSDKPSLEDGLQDTWPRLLKTIKVIENKLRLKNGSRPEETRPA